MEDRRVRRTKSNVFAAMGRLLAKKDITEITVKELCDEADINKSTFYLHFGDIADCRAQWKEYLFHDAFEYADNLDFDDVFRNTPKYIEMFLDSFEKKLDVLKDIRNVNLAADLMFSFKKNLIERIMENSRPDEDQVYRMRIMLAYIVGGTVDACCMSIHDFDREKLRKTLCAPFRAK